MKKPSFDRLVNAEINAIRAEPVYVRERIARRLRALGALIVERDPARGWALIDAGSLIDGKPQGIT